MKPLKTFPKLNFANPTKSGDVPHDTKCEKAILGAIACDSHYAMSEVTELNVTSDAFFDKANALIFKAFKRLFEAGKKMDIVSVKNELEAKSHLEKIGGLAYLDKIYSAYVPREGYLKIWIEILLQLYQRRITISLSQEAISEATNLECDIYALQTKIGEKFINADSIENSKNTPLKDILSDRIKVLSEGKKGDFMGVSSGLEFLDQKIQGFQKNKLIVVGGATGMGKTSLLLKFILEALMQKKSVAFFSLEMSKEEIVDRIISQKCGIPTSKLLAKNLEEKDWQNLYESTADIANKNLNINDSGVQTVESITSSCRRIKYQSGLDIVFVDYLQLMSSNQAYRGNREQEVSAIADGLKKMAKELNVPVIAAAQLSRAIDYRPDKKPQLSDLRESGAIEQNADNVIFVYRPEYYGITEDDDGNPTEGLAKLILAKNRSGPTGQVDVKFESEFTRFSDF